MHQPLTAATTGTRVCSSRSSSRPNPGQVLPGRPDALQVVAGAEGDFPRPGHDQAAQAVVGLHLVQRRHEALAHLHAQRVHRRVVDLQQHHRLG
jgi:hypothetical protein